MKPNLKLKPIAEEKEEDEQETKSSRQLRSRKQIEWSKFSHIWMERATWILNDIEYVESVLDQIEDIAQDVYIIVVDYTKDLVGEDKRIDSDQLITKIKLFCLTHREKELEFSIFDPNQKHQLENALFPIKSEIAIIKSFFN